jgi:hypothetical protein
VSGSNGSKTETQKGIHDKEPEIGEKIIINTRWL